jgi:hypothetical protein
MDCGSINLLLMDLIIMVGISTIYGPFVTTVAAEAGRQEDAGSNGLLNTAYQYTKAQEKSKP